MLLDPSCSGSGMLARVDNDFQEYLDDEDGAQALDAKNNLATADIEKDRLTKLSNFQVSALSHALRFPSLKQLVYSTCSVHKEENEFVVAEILEKFKGKYKLTEGALPEWSHRGIPVPGLTAEEAACLIRANPIEDLCNGFFVAKFSRIS